MTGLVVFVLVIAGLAGSYFYRQKLVSQIADTDKQIANLEKSRDKVFENKFLTLNKQLALVNQLIDNHQFWSLGLAQIESHAQPQVQFINFSADQEKLTFSALAAGYPVVAHQLASLGADDAITNIKLTNVRSKTDGKIEFTAELSFNKTKFIQPINNGQTK